jgi:hypothetical protein
MASEGSKRHERIHLQNIRISAGARRHHFDEKIGIPFLCECDEEQCHEFVVVPLRRFEGALRDRLTVIAAGHAVAGSVQVSSGDGFQLVRIANGRPQTA